jgi:alpha-glucosidase
VQKRADVVDFALAQPQGSFKPALRYYLVKLHGHTATAVTDGKRTMTAADSLDALCKRDAEGWANGHDRYGEVTYVKIAAGVAKAIRLQLRAANPAEAHP